MLQHTMNFSVHHCLNLGFKVEDGSECLIIFPIDLNWPVRINTTLPVCRIFAILFKMRENLYYFSYVACTAEASNVTQFLSNYVPVQGSNILFIAT